MTVEHPHGIKDLARRIAPEVRTTIVQEVARGRIALGCIRFFWRDG
jgi:hypothetical protein